MKKVNCPNCGASMDIEDNREFAFCSYCGTKIILNEIVRIDRNKEINNLLDRAYEYEQKHDYSKARDYCNRVLDIDSKNQPARDLEERLNKVSPIDNVFIEYVSYIDSKFKLRVTRDGYTWFVIEPNSVFSLRLPCGTHNILFAGRKNFTHRIVITDDKKVNKFKYIANSKFDCKLIVEQ